MTYYAETSTLPPNELGEDRQLQIGYFGHGDIFVATWNGSIDHEPNRQDGLSTCFNLRHGCDHLMLAACVGYLRRVTTPEEDIKRIILEAGQEVIEDDLGDMRWHRPGAESMARWISEGTHFERFDKDGLMSLVSPMTAQPGQIIHTGGTAIYTRPNPEGEDPLVYASLLPGGDSDDGLVINETADFSSDDIPAMAKLICNMSQGEYRRDLRHFIGINFLDEKNDL